MVLRPKPRPWSVGEVLADLAELACPPALQERARITLWDDVTSEYDARLLSRHLGRLDLDLSPAFRAAERLWARDEASHSEGFLALYEALFDPGSRRARQLEARRADFRPLSHLFEDEFSILVLLAYDELATVRAFTANLPLYDGLGRAAGRFVRRVIADEAWHYSKFLAVAREGHAHRLPEAAGHVERVRAAEGGPYLNTFVLDHEGDGVWNDEIYDRAAEVLLGHLTGTEPGSNPTGTGAGGV